MTTIGFGLTAMVKDDSREVQNRVIELDIVRAFAIFVILFHHLSQHSFDFQVFHLKGYLLDLTFVCRC